MVREQRVPFGGVSDGVVTAGTDEGGVDRTVDLPNVIRRLQWVWRRP